MFKNAKTMFKVMNEFRKTDAVKPVKKIEKKEESIVNKEVSSEKYYEGPTFFV